jgi:hypothetical protein
VAFSREQPIPNHYLSGDRLTPEDGSEPWETSNIVLLLDPPLDNTTSESLRLDIYELVESLKSTGWERDRDRTWSFLTTADSWRNPVRGGQKLYERPAPAE